MAIPGNFNDIDGHRACGRSEVMLSFFMAGPDQVRWEITQLDSGGCRLAVHHTRGVIVEYIATAQMALLRVQELEDLLTAARSTSTFPPVGLPS